MELVWFNMTQDSGTIYNWFNQFDADTIYSIALLDSYSITIE